MPIIGSSQLPIHRVSKKTFTDAFNYRTLINYYAIYKVDASQNTLKVSILKIFPNYNESTNSVIEINTRQCHCLSLDHRI